MSSTTSVQTVEASLSTVAPPDRGLGSGSAECVAQSTRETCATDFHGYRIEAVMALPNETVPGGEIAHVEERLPPDFGDLFEFDGIGTPPWEQDA